MKALTIKEAKDRGLQVFSYAFDSYVPAMMPGPVILHAQELLYDTLLSQFDGGVDVVSSDADKKAQIFEDVYGHCCGVPGQRFIATFYYSDANGLESIDFFYAIKI